MTLSKRYKGVYKNILENKDISYHITYKENGKKIWHKIGLYSEGIREAFCSKYRSDLMVKLRLGEDAPITLKNKSTFTLHHVALEFFEKKAYIPSTKRTVWGRYKNHVYPALGEKSIHLINNDDIESFYSLLKTKKLSNKSIQLIMEQLSSIINYAFKQKYHSNENPCKTIKLKKVDNARERYLSKEEVNLLIQAVKENENAYMFTLMSLSTGARLSDVYNMQKKNFNLTNKTVTIKNEKGKSTYQAFLKKNVLSVIDLEDLKPNDILYNVSERVIQRFMKKTLDRLFNVGLNKDDRKNRVVVHTLRHTFASHLAIAGTPIYTIKKLLDHKSIEDTLRYAKLSPDCGREFVESLY
jgi:integrase